MKPLGLVAAAVLLEACTSRPSPTFAPASVGPTTEPSATPTSPEPTFPFAFDCGPLDPAHCQGALAVVEARIAAARVEAPDLAPIAGVAVNPPASMLTCPSSGAVCSVIAVVTFMEPGPLAMGLVLAGGEWTWQGQTKGWWGTDGGSYCIPAAAYRVSARVRGIGPCMTTLFDPPPVTITLAVGQALDLHMTVTASRRVPWYPLPWSTAPTVLTIDSASDAADATYLALTPGTVTLMTVGSCTPTATTPTGIGPGFTGPCPVANVRVTAVR
jgi:hypothetical protein